MKVKTHKPSLSRSLALSLIDNDERRAQTIQLLDEFLPQLAADVENDLHGQSAKVFYEIYSEHFHPKIRVILKLKRMEHEYVVLLDAKNSMFVVGSEMGGQHANNALQASGILKTLLMKFKVNCDC